MSRVIGPYPSPPPVNAASIMPRIGEIVSVIIESGRDTLEARGEVDAIEYHVPGPGWAEATVTYRLTPPDSIVPIEAAVMKNLRPLLGSLHGCPVALEAAEDLPIIADWLDDAGDERGPLVRAIGQLCLRPDGAA